MDNWGIDLSSTLTYNFGYKYMYHLVGEQVIPVYLSGIQFDHSIKHFLLTTRSRKTKIATQAICNTFKNKGIDVEVRNIGDEDAAVSVSELTKGITKILDITNPDKLPVSFDLTGGTKPMSMVAMRLATERDYITPYYLDSKGKQLIDFKNLENSLPLRNTLTIKEFVSLGGLELHKQNQNDVSEDFLQYVFDHKDTILRFQEKFANMMDNKGIPKGYTLESYFTYTYSDMLHALVNKVNLEKWDRYWNEFAKTRSWYKKARFLAGEWFELYTYSTVKNSGADISDIMLNAELVFPNNAHQAQEFDVVYTDGFSLIILECKAGQLNQNYIQKLENLRGQFSGALGKCALVSLTDTHTKNSNKETITERIGNSRAIAAFCGVEGIKKLATHCLDFEPGKIYE